MKTIITLLLLTGCASSNGGICPPIRSYTRVEQLNQAATEATLPADSPLVQPLLEWSSLRAQLKKCQ